jgi:hypothetical protein
VSPCSSPCRVSPWGLATPWLSPFPTPLSEGPPSHMGAGWTGVKGSSPPLAPGLHARQAAVPLGPWQLTLFLPRLHQALGRLSFQTSPRFCVACPLTWSNSPPGVPRRESGQLCLRRTQFLVSLRVMSPPSRLSLGTPSQPSPVGTRLGRLALTCLPAGVCWNTTQLSPVSWVLLPPRLIGSHLTTASIPDSRLGRVLRLSLEVTPFLGAGQLPRTGIGPESHGSLGTLGSPFLDLLPCGLLCPYQRTPLRGIMVSTPRGLRARHSPSLNRFGLSRLPRNPTQPSIPWLIWRR